MTTGPAIHAQHRAPAIDLAIIVVVCVLIYWIGLGSTGLSLSEGLRAIPAWEMMDTGDYLVTRMFGEAYFRKPPGMMWAIAASSSIFGQTEFAARAVSAAACTLMPLVAWWFARRWFGPAAGLIAGFAQALTPFFWEAGRSAEIEALHTLFIQLACLSVLDPAVRLRLTLRASPWPSVLLFVGLVGALLTKGPAGVPVVGAAILASIWLARTTPNPTPTAPRSAPAPFLRSIAPSVLAAAVVAALVFFVLIKGHRTLPTVTQSPGEFLWDTTKLGPILALPLVGLAAALPASLALLALPTFWARRVTDPRHAVLATIMLAALVSLLIFTAVGVSNPRYTMPVVPLWPVALGGLFAAATTNATTRRLRTAGIALAALLLAAGVTASQLADRARAGDGGRGSGKPAGEAIARAIAASTVVGPVELWADGAVEARPEVLLYARRAAAAESLDLRPRWSSALLRPFAPPAEAFVLVRVEGVGGAVTEGGEPVALGRPVLWEGRAAKFDLKLLGPRSQR